MSASSRLGVAAFFVPLQPRLSALEGIRASLSLPKGYQALKAWEVGQHPMGNKRRKS
ncbi:MAG: hypothetical protein JWR69_923 [Pedosphaera sp.]|nr:hypothetical protein [Pedosphaera sp.]